MARIAYVNGRFTPLPLAVVGIEDRGLQFADSVYEGFPVRGGALRDAEGHFARLERSLRELRIDPPMGRAALELVLAELVRRNRVRQGLLYLQITRGEAPRDHAFPSVCAPTLIATVRAFDPRALAGRMEKGVAVITVPDIRWGRCDIKSTGLTANVLAKQAAKEAGAGEAWLTSADGTITEGASTNAWIVTGDGVLVTRPASDNILNGVTRRGVLAIAAGLGVAVEERGFSAGEAKSAAEAFLTAASGPVVPVVSIDGAAIGDGAPGKLTRALQAAYLAGEN